MSLSFERLSWERVGNGSSNSVRVIQSALGRLLTFSYVVKRLNRARVFA
jgi:hypothetical protein